MLLFDWKEIRVIDGCPLRSKNLSLQRDILPRQKIRFNGKSVERRRHKTKEPKPRLEAGVRQSVAGEKNER